MVIFFDPRVPLNLNNNNVSLQKFKVEILCRSAPMNYYIRESPKNLLESAVEAIHCASQVVIVIRPLNYSRNELSGVYGDGEDSYQASSM